MNRFFAVIILLIGAATIASCSKKTIRYQSDGRIGEFAPIYTSYDYLSSKAKVVIEEESGKVTRGTMNLRAKKDSV